jgi:cation diffusion facilitator family transporter
VVNVASSTAVYASLRYSSKPADDRHPYGHHKAEYFSAVLVGALIVLAAFAIAREAWAAAQDPRLQDGILLGLGLNALAGIGNALWRQRLLRAAREHGSPALEADAEHLLADVLGSVGVLAGVALAVATDTPWLDPALAALIAVNVLWSGWRLIRASVGALMDEAVDEERLSALKRVIAENGDGSLEAHDVRTRRAGRATFVDFHLVVPGEMSVAAAHAICDRLEAAIAEAMPGARVSIHVEPEGKAKHTGVVVL